jgi:acyl-CoA synthetase (NDP forming)/GNAT superfamily N-acetyltransferase
VYLGQSLGMVNTGLGEVDAVRADGGLAHIRQICPDDAAAIRALHARSSDRSIYLRFFTVGRGSADHYVETLLREASDDHRGLVAIVGGEIVATAAYERTDPDTAEVALLVEDSYQHEGIGTLLIEHLASVARHCGIHQFEAEVLAENTPMIRVFNDLGFQTSSVRESGELQIVFSLDPAKRLITAIDERERAADVASLRRLLSPRSIAVVGASTRARSVGHEVLRNLKKAHFSGGLYVVNPHHDAVLGIPSVPSAIDLPTAPDLAIIAVPAEQVPEAIRACGARGIGGALLLTAGFGETGAAGMAFQNEVLAIARSFGMRLIGPNCLGVVNTDPAVRLNATFAPLPQRQGPLALVSQSGALGIAVLAAADRCGLGIAQFVSVGNKADVSGNDLLLAWEKDDRVRVIGLYLESFGNPRKFARIARRVAHRKPIIAIKAGRTPAGQRAGQSHTAAAASADSAVDALFRQAGVLRVDTMEGMLDAARVLSQQPLPAGPRIAVVGNSGGPEILAADAAASAKLSVEPLSEKLGSQIRQLVPSVASVANPIDLGAGVHIDAAVEVIRALLASDEVDAVLAVFTPTLVTDVGELLGCVAEMAAQSNKPLVAVEVGGVSRSLAGADKHSVPVFTFPEPAAAALGLAWRYRSTCAVELAEIDRPAEIDAAAAREFINRRLAENVEWLAPQDVARIFIRYGIHLAPQRIVTSKDAAVQAAADLRYPVVMKVVGEVHKSDTGGVRLGVANAEEVAAALCELAAMSSGHEVLIQPVIGPGTELIVGAAQDQQFGPILMVGAGGVLTDLIADRTFRLAPVTSQEASTMLDELRISPLLDGYRGRPVVSRSALVDLLVRVATLIDDLPQVRELDLNPVICNGDELIAVDAKVRIATSEPALDPLVRQLRGPVHISATAGS